MITPNFVKTLSLKLICSIFIIISCPTKATILSLQPSFSQVTSGDILGIDLVVDDLGSSAEQSIGAFDIDISYDSNFLSFEGFMLDNFLGNESFFEAIDVSFGDLGGVVNIAQISFLDDFELRALQPNSFRLAQLDFSVNNILPGSYTDISFGSNVLISDAFGSQITFSSLLGTTITASDNEISPVNAPSSLGIFVTSMLILWSRKKSY